MATGQMQAWAGQGKEEAKGRGQQRRLKGQVSQRHGLRGQSEQRESGSGNGNGNQEEWRRLRGKKVQAKAVAKWCVEKDVGQGAWRQSAARGGEREEVAGRGAPGREVGREALVEGLVC